MNESENLWEVEGEMSYLTYREEIEDMPHAACMNDGKFNANYVWRVEASEIAARADARIAELEKEVERWRAEVAMLCGYDSTAEMDAATGVRGAG